MMLPTVYTLKYLSRYDSVQAIQQAAAHGLLWSHAPRFVLDQGKERALIESDLAYGEAAMVCPDGQVLHDIAWQNRRAVPLRKNLLRLTAPNANVMTGPGTNSYLVGEQATGYIAIDPGPADRAHVQRLLDAAGGYSPHCLHPFPSGSLARRIFAAVAVRDAGLAAADLRHAIGGHFPCRQPVCARCGAARW